MTHNHTPLSGTQAKAYGRERPHVMDPPARRRAAFPARLFAGSQRATQYADPVRIHAIFGGIGGFAVKFRWLVIVVWVVAAVAVPSSCRHWPV